MTDAAIRLAVLAQMTTHVVLQDRLDLNITRFSINSDATLSQAIIP